MEILKINNGNFILEYDNIYSDLYCCNGDGITGLVIKEINNKFFKTDGVYIESGWKHWGNKCAVAVFKILYSIDGVNYNLYKQFDKYVGNYTWEDNFKIELDVIKSLKIVALKNNHQYVNQKKMNISKISLINPTNIIPLCILNKNGVYKTFKNNKLVDAKCKSLSLDLFKIDGFCDLELLNNIDKTDMKLLVYDESNPDKLKLKYTLKESFKPIDKFEGKIEMYKKELWQ